MDKDGRLDQDSINWGAASKGTAKKVYGDLEREPHTFGRKIEMMKLAEKLALGEITLEVYDASIQKIKENII